MSDKPVLRPNQRKAIRALLEESTKGAAAQVVGVSERTITRWLSDPVFVAGLRAAETDLIGEALRDLVLDLQDNHGVIRSIRDDKEISPGVRLKAAGMLDASLLRWRGLLDVEERIEELEKVVYGELLG